MAHQIEIIGGIDGVPAFVKQVKRFAKEEPNTAQYHRDFIEVWRLAQTWLDADVALLATDQLVLEVGIALASWGAGQKAAPCVGGSPDIAAALNAARPKLLRLRAGDPKLVADNDGLLCLLHLIAGAMVGNTNVTYPTKLAMLLTGQYVGLDNKVRVTLGRQLRWEGFAKTQYLLPAVGADSADATRVRELEAAIRAFWHTYGTAVQAELVHQKVPNSDVLAQCPGRLLDMVLFRGGQSLQVVQQLG